jgi:dipeptidyl aminopeptidase/acylaminoacyl peptidase
MYRPIQINRRLISIMLALALSFSSAALATPLAEFVAYKAEDGQILNALLYLPKRPTRTAVIMVPGGTGGIGGRHDYTPLAEKLNAKGYALLVVNMRTAGSNGWLYGRFEDSELDVGAAVEFAKSRNLDQVVLFGSSLGGPRIMYYWAQTKDPVVEAMGFLASVTSPYLEVQVRFDKDKRDAFDDFLQEARNLVKDGKGRQPITLPDWFPGASFTLSAESYLSYFGTPEESNANSLKFADQLNLPAVVIHGEEDNIVLPPVAETMYDSLTAAASREMIWIEAAGHYITAGPIAESYAEAVVDWVTVVIPLSK